MRIDSEDVVKLALGRKELPDADFTPWETILAEIIVGDAFGVDRMDYLLRDSHHAGVAYGKFDQYRLIDTLRILPRAPSDAYDEGEVGFALGVEEGGLQSAEALMLARYFMYSQVYFHPIRRIYDLHLKDFLIEWLGDDGYPTDTERHARSRATRGIPWTPTRLPNQSARTFQADLFPQPQRRGDKSGGGRGDF
jgi:HD superfamily phosphohydrolase